MSNIKIIAIHQGNELYGSDRSFITTVSILLKSKKFDLDIVLPSKGPILELINQLEGNFSINYEKMSILRKSDVKRLNFSFLFSFFRRKNIKKYDVVYINTIVILDYILLKLNKNQKKIIHVRELPKGLKLLFFKRILNRSNAYLIFNSNATKNTFKSLKVKGMYTVDNGVNGFTEVNKIEEINNLNLLLIGRINSWKGQDLLIKAIHEIPDEFKTKISVKIVGDVYEKELKYKDNLIKLLDNYNLSKTVEILPFTKEPQSLFKWSHIIIVPSKQPEPFGRVAIEAMSASRPVIAAAHGGLKSIVVDKKTGLLFEPNNAKDLASKIVYLLSNPSYIIKMGEEGKKRFEEFYSTEVYEKKILETFDEILKK